MANVSISIVSHIINNEFKGDTEVKENVFKVISSLNYKPNPLARRFAAKKVESKIIGVIASFFIDLFFVEVLKGSYKILHKNGYNIVFYDIISREMKKKIIAQIQGENHLDGVIMISMHLNNS